MIDLTDRVVVVTGAASGIGRAVATLLSSAGARVAVADIDDDGAAETVAVIESRGGKALAVHVDVTDTDSIKILRADVERNLGTVSVLVNNVGWDIVEPFLDNHPDYWRRVIDLNYLAVVTVAREFIEPMAEQEIGGRVINIASDAGRVGSSGETVYAGAKGAVIAFSKSLAREMAPHQITVNCVCPGPTDTPLFRSQPKKMQESLIRAIPLRRLGDPFDVAGAVLYFASSHASYVTGQVLSVSGGLTMAG
jgi:2-hydroxycyclohexanecarboxyl-CoA dehydrogenase